MLIVMINMSLLFQKEGFQSAVQRTDGKCTLRWRHNGRDSVSNHQPHDCLLNRLFRRRSKKTTKLRVTGLCAGNSPVPGEFPAQMASNAENVSIWWRDHDIDFRESYKNSVCSEFSMFLNLIEWLTCTLVANYSIPSYISLHQFWKRQTCSALHDMIYSCGRFVGYLT